MFGNNFADILKLNVQEKRLEPVTKPLLALVDAVKPSPGLNAKDKSLKPIDSLCLAEAQSPSLKAIETDPLWTEKEKEEMGETAEKYLNFWIGNLKKKLEMKATVLELAKYLKKKHTSIKGIIT